MKKINALCAIILIIVLAGCSALYAVTLPLGEQAGFYILSVAIFVAGVFVCFLFQALWHELGHVIFGGFAGFSFCRFSFGPINFDKSGKKIKVTFGKNAYAGAVSAISKKTDKLLSRYFFLTFGGIFFSFISAVSLAILAIFLREIDFLSYSFLLSATFSGWYVCVLNVLPFNNGGARTDGAVLLGILTKDNRVTENVSLMAIQGLLYSGKSPREIDRNFFYKTELEGAEGIQITSCRYAYELDCENFDEAIILSDKMASEYFELPEIFQKQILADVFYTELVLKKNFDRAKVLWKHVEDYLKKNADVTNLRIRMAEELFLENSPKKALETGKQALSLQDESLSGIRAMEERILNKLISKAENYDTSENNNGKSF